VENSTFTGNYAYGYGGGVYKTGGGLIRDCTISGNNAANGGGVYIHGTGTIESSIIQNNTGDRGGGIGLGFENAVAQNCTITGNVASGNFGDGGGIYLSAGGTVERCRIRDNRARRGGGVYFHDTKGQVINSLLLNNTALDVDPAVQGQGGAAYFYKGGYILNSTVTGNTAVETGGVTLYFDEGGGGAPVGTVQNSILWGNTASQGSVGGSPTALTYSLVQGWTGSGEGNLDKDTNPLFVEGGDYRLQKNSPCKNKGSNSAPGLTARDLAGWPRIIEGVVDLGAYEYGTVAADFSGSPLKGPFPLSVLFTAATWGTVTGYQWSFGDGGQSPDPNPAHLYHTPGHYSVSLTVIGTEASETVTRTNYIEVLEKRPAFLPLILKGTL
jgi:parallel beta-helix repeat protein